MKTYIKQSITQVRKAIKDDGVWRGLLVGNKVSQHHFENGYCLARYDCFLTIKDAEETRDIMLFYLDKELGNNIAFYVIKEEL